MNNDRHHDSPGWAAYLPLLISLCLLAALQAAYAAGIELAFDRAAIEGGHWWLLASGQLVHSNWTHFILNTSALIAVWLAFPNHLTLMRLLPLAIIGNGLALYYLEPQLLHYVGLSSVLHTLFVVGALAMLSSSPWMGALLLVAVTAKIGSEQLGLNSQAGMEALIATRVATEAHLWGAVLGIGLFALNYLCRTAVSKLPKGVKDAWGQKI